MPTHILVNGTPWTPTHALPPGYITRETAEYLAYDFWRSNARTVPLRLRVGNNQMFIITETSRGIFAAREI